MGTSQVEKGAYALFILVTLDAGFGNLSQSGMNAMLPDVMVSLGLTIETGQWLMTGFMLVMAVSMSPATFLYQRLTPQTFMIVSFFLALSGSVISFLAPSFAFLMTGRLLQAISTGLSIPFMQTVTMEFFPPGRQATVMGVAGIALSFVPNVGPAVGGFLNNFFGWRSFFLVLICIFGVLLIGAIVLIRSFPRMNPNARFDFISFVQSTIGFGGVLMGLSLVSYQGILSGLVLVPLLVGITSLILFFRRQRHIADPFMDLRIFKSRQFCIGVLASCFLFASYMGAALVIPLYIQNILGGTSLDSAFVLLPSMFAALLINPLAGWLADKKGYRLVFIVFGTMLLIGALGCILLGSQTDLQRLTLFQTLRIVGVSGLTGPLTTYTLAGLSRRMSPYGSSALALLRQVAGTFGTALMIFCITLLAQDASIAAFDTVFPYQVSFACSALIGFTCLVTALRAPQR